MATVKQLRTQIENANTLGRANLAEKGVELPESATTYEIMQGIADISAGGGDYTEAYNLMTKEMPVEDTESGIVNYIGALVGVSE